MLAVSEVFAPRDALGFVGVDLGEAPLAQANEVGAGAARADEFLAREAPVLVRIETVEIAPPRRLEFRRRNGAVLVGIDTLEVGETLRRSGPQGEYGGEKYGEPQRDAHRPGFLGCGLSAAGGRGRRGRSPSRWRR